MMTTIARFSFNGRGVKPRREPVLRACVLKPHEVGSRSRPAFEAGSCFGFLREAALAAVNKSHIPGATVRRSGFEAISNNAPSRLNARRSSNYQRISS